MRSAKLTHYQAFPSTRDRFVNACSVATLALLAIVGPTGCAVSAGSETVPATADRRQQAIVELNDDGSWTWFSDERAIVHHDTLLVASVADGRNDPSRRGNVEVTSYHIATGKRTRTVLHRYHTPDDHNVPALLARSDGTVLVLWTGHAQENRFHYRATLAPGIADRWGASQHHRTHAIPKRGLTYSNLLRLTAEDDDRCATYAFTRGIGNSRKPSLSCSDDDGRSWNTLGPFIHKRPPDRIYAQYTANGRDTIHALVTDGHPERQPANSVYHLAIRDRNILGSDGRVLETLDRGLRDPSQATPVVTGDRNRRYWLVDLELDSAERPVAVLSAHVRETENEKFEDSPLLYYYARWDGAAWQVHDLAYAGTKIFEAEKIMTNHYTGLAAIDPDDTTTVFISTNADPATGDALISAADGKRHFEIFRGSTRDGGESWEWTAITRSSTRDNLRPIVPRWNDRDTALIWLRGRMESPRSWDLEVVARFFR